MTYETKCFILWVIANRRGGVEGVSDLITIGWRHSLTHAYTPCPADVLAGLPALKGSFRRAKRLFPESRVTAPESIEYKPFRGLYPWEIALLRRGGEIFARHSTVPVEIRINLSSPARDLSFSRLKKILLIKD